jgi:tRNA-binding protein
MATITWSDFTKVELRAGTVIEVQEFPEARKPAYKLTIDFGPQGVKKSSAQITGRYQKGDILGKKVICVMNFATKQIGSFISEVLVTGFTDETGNIALASTEINVPDGSLLI